MPRILDGIQEPSNLRTLDEGQLKQLTQEIREELVRTVTETGGHLASNLGAVELTIALHTIFESPRDKIIWDVGHQTYIHKLLTGRRERFSTIRQYGGLSGFPEPAESSHDVFGTGHASTSISAALGMATARDMAGEDYHVIAVIGDGALTGGMAFEALNQAGHLGTRLIVVLNDNAMSISPNVGALSHSLNRLRFSPRYYRTKKQAERFVTRLPLGRSLWELGKRLRNIIKGMLMPTLLWEEFGFAYMGPVNGHNIRELQSVLRKARDYGSKPVFIHVLTTKGKGYEPAEDDAVGYHGLPPNGTSKSNAPTYSKVFGETVLRLAQQDERIVAIGAAMVEGTGLSLMARELPHRVFDVGICEQHAVTFAAGMATRGLRPIVAIYSTFLQRAFDQVLHDVCIQNLPVVFALDRGGIVGDDGRTHQGLFDLSYLRQIPNMILASPKDENELQHLLLTAVKAKGPMAVRYPRGYGVGVPMELELHQLPIGRGELLRQGGDVALVALGPAVHTSLEAAEGLGAMGVGCAVVNARFVKPLDRELILEMAHICGRLVTVEENVLAGGFGSAVLELLQAEGLEGVKLERIGIPDEFVPHGSQEILRSKYDLTADGILRRVLEAFPELAQGRQWISGETSLRA